MFFYRAFRRTGGEIMNNQQRLRELIILYSLRLQDVASLCRASPATAASWTKNRAGRRNMPDASLELLCIKLREPSPFPDPLARFLPARQDR